MDEMSTSTSVKQREYGFNGGVPHSCAVRIPDENSVSQMPHHHHASKISNVDETKVYCHPQNCIRNGDACHLIPRNNCNDYRLYEYKQEWRSSYQQALDARNRSASCPRYPTPVPAFAMTHRRPSVLERAPLTEIPSSSQLQHIDMNRSDSIPLHETFNKNMKRSLEGTESCTLSSPHPHTSPPTTSISQKENKRPKSSNKEQALQVHDFERADFSKLKMLCDAIDFQVKKDRITGCSCPRSRCIKLYCECFQSGTKCTSSCRCKKCKNTDAESGPDGARTKAINKILSRNPQAFDKDKPQLDRGRNIGIVCRCVKSQCLKLYCDCFQRGNICGPYCMCLNCLNTEKESGEKGKRTLAAIKCLERKPDAFQKKKKEVGSGCSCKNSR